MNHFQRTSIAIFCLICLGGTIEAYDWPVWPDSTVHYIGNGYAEYQYYPGYGDPLFHTGIDILVPIETPVYSATAGWVKAILTAGGVAHWRIVIGECQELYGECDGYMYSHLVEESMVGEAGLSVGDWVEEGQFIGRVTHYTWIDDSTIIFDHLHFSRVHASNWPNFSTWDYIGNPFDSLDNIFDPDPPVFEDAIEGQLFGFCYNLVPLYYDPGATLSGEVDIICHVYDYINHYDWKLNPNKIEYRFEGPTTTDWIHGICFNSPIGAYGGPTQLAVNVVYQNDATCQSLSDFYDREYYFNITNNDGDSLIEASDDNYAWNTFEYLNGEYTIYVRATDPAGNSTIASMSGVSIENHFSLDGTINLNDAPGDLSGSIVTSVSTGESVTTDASGDFSIPIISGGPHQITVRHDGYWPEDTVLMIDANQSLALTMQSIDFICGDANGTEDVNQADIVFLTNYLFNNGPAPDPLEAGNVNTCGGINIADITFLTHYIFGEGPAPCEPYMECELPTGDNLIALGCPLDIQFPSGDSVGLPLYITNDLAISAMTLGFGYNSDDIEVTSIDFTGSVINGLSPLFYLSPNNNTCLIICESGGEEILPQAGGLMATIWIQIPAETPDQIVDIDSLFIAPGSEFIFATKEGNTIRPAWTDCGSEDIIITSPYTCGDANGDDDLNVGDAVTVINYVFKGGAAPDPVCEGDANGDTDCNVADAVFMINYVFNAGAEPGPDCCN